MIGGHVSEGGGASHGRAGNVARIIARVEAARGVARGVKTLDGGARRVEHLGASVDGQAAHRGQDDVRREQRIVGATGEGLVVARVAVVLRIALDGIGEQLVVLVFFRFVLTPFMRLT